MELCSLLWTNSDRSVRMNVTLFLFVKKKKNSWSACAKRQGEAAMLTQEIMLMDKITLEKFSL